MYITDTIPAGLSYTGTLLGNGASTEDTSTPGEIVWTVPNVPANTCVTLSPQFVISPDFTGTRIDHEVTVAGQVGTDGPIVGDDTPANNESTDPITVTQPSPPPAPTPDQAPIKKVIKEVQDTNNNGTKGDAGDTVIYELTFTNNEDELAYFTLTDQYDSTLTNPVIGAAGDNAVAGVNNGNTITRDAVELAANSSDTLLVQFTIDANAAPNTQYTNTFSYTYVVIKDCTTGDTNAGNNDNSVGLPFDLALRKRIADTTPVYNLGDDVTYAITVFNQGIIPATQIVINEEVPTAGDCLSFDAANNI